MHRKLLIYLPKEPLRMRCVSSLQRPVALNSDIVSSTCQVKSEPRKLSWVTDNMTCYSILSLSLRFSLLDTFGCWLSGWGWFHVWKSKRAWLSFSIQSNISCLVSAENQHLEWEKNPTPTKHAMNSCTWDQF